RPDVQEDTSVPLTTLPVCLRESRAFCLELPRIDATAGTLMPQSRAWISHAARKTLFPREPSTRGLMLFGRDLTSRPDTDIS
ncbi:MAG: hypothetical protein P8182_06340, partial [Deltaproteobacteria bacterium]